MSGRVTLDQPALDRFLRRELTTRGRAALAAYREVGRREAAYNQPDYPFARHDQPSIFNASSGSVRPIPGGVRISVTAPAASMFEYGNETSGNEYIYPKNGNFLALPLRRGRKRGRIQVGSDGRAYLAVERVRTYKGRFLLEKSVRAAFGARAIIRRV